MTATSFDGLMKVMKILPIVFNLGGDSSIFERITGLESKINILLEFKHFNYYFIFPFILCNMTYIYGVYITACQQCGGICSIFVMKVVMEG